MRWTCGIPLLPGWYWVRGTENPSFVLPLLNEPEKEHQGNVFQKAYALRYYGSPFGYGDLECYGPIEVPK